MLDEFRSTSITWDKATRRIYSPISANESDSNGRKLNIQVVNSGQVENLTGATLHLYWETKDKTQHGLDAFAASDISKGEFEIFYTTGMLSNVGELNATLVLVDTTGKVVSDWFKITVARGIDDDAIQSENSFTTLTQALIDVSNLEQNYTPRLNDLTAQLQQKADKSHVESLVGNLADATPKFASGVGEMSDTSKLYVNTSDGYLYVHSGSTWTNTGVLYQSTGIADKSVTLSMLGPITDALNLFPDKLMKDITQYVSSSGNVIDVENVNLNGFNAIKFTNNNPTSEAAITYGRQVDIPIDGNRYSGGDIHISISVAEIMRASVSTTNTIFQLSIIPYDLTGKEITGHRATTNIGILGINESTYLPPIGTAFVRFRFDLRVYAGTEAGDSIVIDSILVRTPSYNSHQHAIGVVEYMDLQDRVAAIESSGALKKKMIHLSVDDALVIFDDLTNGSYESMFEHPVLYFFKRMNDEYGATFSLYLFYENTTFDLSQMTDKFKLEFESNSDWLKLGFHAKNVNRNYTTYTTHKVDYDLTINEIIRFAGVKSIDFVHRIHYYASTLDAVKAWKSTEYGALGLYTADDARLSYYLNQAQEDYLLEHNELFDPINSFYFIKTNFRLEKYNTVETLLTHLNDYTKDTLTIFTHEPRLYEQIYLDKIEASCQFAKENRYTFGFPMDNINVQATLN